MPCCYCTDVDARAQRKAARRRKLLSLGLDPRSLKFIKLMCKA